MVSPESTKTFEISSKRYLRVYPFDFSLILLVQLVLKLQAPRQTVGNLGQTLLRYIFKIKQELTVAVVLVVGGAVLVGEGAGKEPVERQPAAQLVLGVVHHTDGKLGAQRICEAKRTFPGL